MTERVRHLVHNERGAALVEAAIVLPVMLLVAIGSFDLFNGMIAKMQLQFTVGSAAQVEARKAGTGVPWASSQMPAASFQASSGSCGATITGTEQVSTFILPSYSVNALACAPITS
jgi:Flp pilus assembly pilin Flp